MNYRRIIQGLVYVALAEIFAALTLFREVNIIYAVIVSAVGFVVFLIWLAEWAGQHDKTPIENMLSFEEEIALIRMGNKGLQNLKCPYCKQTKCRCGASQ